jgi:hypothetical protein
VTTLARSKSVRAGVVTGTPSLTVIVGGQDDVVVLDARSGSAMARDDHLDCFASAVA